MQVQRMIVIYMREGAVTGMNATIESALAELKHGHAIIFPTDTVYGLGVSVKHASSPDIIYTIKERDRHKPIAWLVNGTDDLETYGKVVPDYVKAIADELWPGPLTIIVRASDAVPESFRSSEGTIGLRMPSNKIARTLIERIGCPIATSSANLAGAPSPCSFDEIDPQLLDRVPTALDDEEPKSGIASTVINCSTGHTVVVREGAISIADLNNL
jgi:L-threonylcarbamoyladenylate synthase